MKLIFALFLIYLFSESSLSAQAHYSERKTNFSSSEYDEFSPVVEGDSIVFCSDRQNELFIKHVGSDKKGLLNIFFARISDSSRYQRPNIFGPDLNSPYNNGPITFDSSGTFAIYCRNMVTGTKTRGKAGEEGNIGLFSAEYKNGSWVNIKPFKYNNPSYSNITPFLTSDGRYLYFSSDMPGGFGGTDIYKCEYENDGWSNPINLGDVINTSGNEVSPFINLSGDLFFASDGHQGLGKKDLFMSKKQGKEWLKPLHIDPPLNSEFDDFSLITDNSFSAGYFSSDRDGTDDIFSFKTLIPQLYDCDSLKRNNYCYRFWDNKNPGSDSLKADYEWQFSDGSVIKGISVEHCFQGSGHYWALLKISDTATGETFVVRDSIIFEINDYVQPYITSKDTLYVSEEAVFSALKSNLPGFQPEEYIWDFGDGKSVIGKDVTHKFINAGVYNVKLGIKGKSGDNSGTKTNCVFKQVCIINMKDL